MIASDRPTGVKLRALGVNTKPARRAALMQLAAEVPAAVLADMLDLAPNTAVHWVELAAGDWTRYVADRINDAHV